MVGHLSRLVRHLDVEGNQVATGFDERLDVPLGLGDHQMGIEEHLAALAKRLDDRHAETDVRHEVAIHHIEMEYLRPGLFNFRNLVAQTREVRCQQ